MDTSRLGLMPEISPTLCWENNLKHIKLGKSNANLIRIWCAFDWYLTANLIYIWRPFDGHLIRPRRSAPLTANARQMRIKSKSNANQICDIKCISNANQTPIKWGFDPHLMCIWKGDLIRIWFGGPGCIRCCVYTNSNERCPWSAAILLFISQPIMYIHLGTTKQTTSVLLWKLGCQARKLLSHVTNTAHIAIMRLMENAIDTSSIPTANLVRLCDLCSTFGCD